MEPAPHIHRVQVYYEDTDHSGMVYHANYLKYFERAREHYFGVHALRELGERDGLGFVVYRANLAYRKAARFADALRVETTPTLVSPYRAHFKQCAIREEGDQLLVSAEIDLVMVDQGHQPVAFPESVVNHLSAGE